MTGHNQCSCQAVLKEQMQPTDQQDGGRLALVGNSRTRERVWTKTTLRVDVRVGVMRSAAE